MEKASTCSDEMEVRMEVIKDARKEGTMKKYFHSPSNSFFFLKLSAFSKELKLQRASFLYVALF